MTSHQQAIRNGVAAITEEQELEALVDVLGTSEAQEAVQAHDLPLFVSIVQAVPEALVHWNAA